MFQYPLPFLFYWIICLINLYYTRKRREINFIVYTLKLLINSNVNINLNFYIDFISLRAVFTILEDFRGAGQKVRNFY